MLKLIQTQPGLRIAELASQTGRLARTVERWVKQLKIRQLIEFRGAPKTGGYYPKVNGGASGGASGGVNGGVNLELDNMLKLIQTQPGLRVAELASQVDKPARTIERWLKQLRSLQLIEFHGAPKTGGYYPK